MGTYTPLKHYFAGELATRLAQLIAPVYPEFPTQSFVQAVEEKVEPLELKERVQLIAEQLRQAINLEYPEQLHILLSIIGPEIEKEEGMFTEGYFLMPIAYFVECYGLEHFDLSMAALYEITKRHTSEYAIRPYLLRYPAETLEKLHAWASDENAHVRRLVSEGTRPRLPWAKRINAIYGDPLVNLALLELLLNDQSAYVRKSVANHLNDLTKDFKDVTIEWMVKQLESGRLHDASTIRRALRTLVKTNDSAATNLLDRVNR